MSEGHVYIMLATVRCIRCDRNAEVELQLSPDDCQALADEGIFIGPPDTSNRVLVHGCAPCTRVRLANQQPPWWEDGQ